jgi:hypothetical protein
MAQITGKATLRVDGKEIRTDGKGKLKIGGEKREPVTGPGKVHGYKEETEAPELEVKVAHTADLSLKTLQAITNATVAFETDTGRQFILREAFTTDVLELDAADGVTLKMSALSCDEV